MKLAPASLSVLALAMATSACPNPHPSDVAPAEVQRDWRDSEQSLKEIAAHMPTLTAPRAGGSFDLTALGNFVPSDRHGADDMRRLSRYDSTAHTAVGDGALAHIIAVKGIEYKSLADLGAHPYPIAIIHVIDTGTAGQYPKLGLKPGTNYWIVKYDEAHDTWQGWIQPPSGPAVRLATSATGFDKVEPVSAARFVWDAKDEALWGLCGGRCCTSKGPALQ